MKMLSDKKIIDSWQKNGKPWIKAVQKNQIESRVLITDKAIIDCISDTSAKTVLDLGCGEGWLTRQLTEKGFEVAGLDVNPELITEARTKSNNPFFVLPYEELSETTITSRFDLAVCNFSLLGKESVNNLLEQIPLLLNSSGQLIIQTPHPRVSCGQQAYKDGWRQGSWEGFSEDFIDPAPWYFRTVESWIKLLSDNNFRIEKMLEPTFPDSDKIASLILLGRLQ